MEKLKEQALLERIGQLTVMYEDKIADLRVELTNLATELSGLRESLTTTNHPEVVEGNLVQ